MTRSRETLRCHESEAARGVGDDGGLGIAALPEWLIEDDLVSGQLVRVLPKWQARELPAHVVYPAQRRLPLRVRTFIDFAVDYVSTVLRPGKR